MNRLQAESLDQHDVLAPYRAQFKLPQAVYLCGHSLGLMPFAAAKKITETVNTEWGEEVIGAWNANWLDMPKRLGGKIAPWLGVGVDEVIVADSVSINLFKLLLAALKLRPGRHIILTEEDNFPGDLYIAKAVAALQTQVEVVICKREDIPLHLNEQVAVLLLTHVNYKTAELHDLKKMTALAQQQGALMLVDLAHSVGVMPLALQAAQVDLAVGCGYKYLNGGPGAPAFLYVAAKHQENIASPLTGWMGHATPFAFHKDYVAAKDINKFLCGTPPILSMSSLEASMDIFKNISALEIKNKNEKLGDSMIALAAEKCPSLQLLSPQNAALRGGHLAFKHEHAYALSRALRLRGFVCDFRSPDVIRVGLSPLYLRYVDVWDTVAAIANIIDENQYDKTLKQNTTTVT